MVIKFDTQRGFGAIPNNRPPLWSSFPAWMMLDNKHHIVIGCQQT
jgi:hypothetical protein